MKPIFLVCHLLGALVFFGAQARSQFEPPVVEQKIDPVYPADLKAFLVQPVKVELVIDDAGAPFSLKSSAGLPDVVVQALSSWRFRPARNKGKAVPSSISLVVPIKRPMEGTGRMARKWWRPSQEDTDAFRAGQAADAASAAKLEDSLKRNPDERKSHIMLLGYAEKLGDEGIGTRLDQVLWLAKNGPREELLGAPVASIPRPTSTAGDTYEQLRQLWLKALAENPKDPVILDHATNFLRFSDPEVVTNAALRAVREDEKAAVFLGDLYGLAALGVTAVEPVHGLAAKAGERMPATPFAEKARVTLAGTDDLRVLFAALTTVRDSGASLADAGRQPAGYAEFCGGLLARAKSFYPETTLRCEGAVTPPEFPWLRAGGTVQQARIRRQVTPVYPAGARHKGIQGTVRFSAVIGEDGLLKHVELLSGPLVLYQSARAAVLGWEYNPTLMNGKPVPVETTLEVNYSLHR